MESSSAAIVIIKSNRMSKPEHNKFNDENDETC